MKLRHRAAVAIVIALLAAGSFAVLAPAGPAVAFSSGGLFLDVQVEEPAHLVARSTSRWRSPATPAARSTSSSP
jgi:hypothetical protein